MRLPKVDLRFVYVPYELHALAEYLNTTSAHIALLESELPEHLAVRMNSAYNTGDEAEISIAGQEVYDIQENVFPRYYRNYACLAVFGTFESCVLSIATETTRISKGKLNFGDLGGMPFLERARKFFEVVVGVEFAADNAVWERLKALELVRNCVVHANGQLDLIGAGQRKKLNGLMSNARGLRLTSHGDWLMVDELFINQSFEAVNSAVADLVRDVRIALDRRKRTP